MRRSARRSWKSCAGGRRTVARLTNKPPTTPALPTLEDTASRDAAARKAVQQAEAVKALIDNLQFEHDLIGATDRQREIETALRQAGAAATDAQRQKIEALVGATYDMKSANEALADSMAEIADIGQTALRGFIDDLIAGKSAGGVPEACCRISAASLDMNDRPRRWCLHV